MRSLLNQYNEYMDYLESIGKYDLQLHLDIIELEVKLGLWKRLKTY